MRIHQITEQKKAYLDILLLANPREDMIESYLDAGDMFALYDEEGEVQSVCVVTTIGDGTCELNIVATRRESQGRGYGKALVHYICEKYSYGHTMMYVEKKAAGQASDFFRACGFAADRTEKSDSDTDYLKTDLMLVNDPKRVVELALEAGRILLKNGGEIFRVEETIQHICRRFHVENVDLFTMSHAIIISVKVGDGDAYSRVKHVPLSAAHLGIVAEVNDLSREIAAGKVGLQQAEEKLKEIDKIPPKKSYFQILSAGVGSACFGFILGAGIRESVVAFLVGCILYIWVLTAKKYHISKIILNIVGGALITTLALAALQIARFPLKLDGIIIGSIMPLVPGMAFVNAIRDIADSDFLSGTVRMIDALLVFVYIAIGVGFTLGVYSNMAGGMML